MEYRILTIDPCLNVKMHHVGHDPKRAEGYFKAFARQRNIFVALFEVDWVEGTLTLKQEHRGSSKIDVEEPVKTYEVPQE